MKRSPFAGDRTLGAAQAAAGLPLEPGRECRQSGSVAVGVVFEHRDGAERVISEHVVLADRHLRPLRERVWIAERQPRRRDCFRANAKKALPFVDGGEMRVLVVDRPEVAECGKQEEHGDAQRANCNDTKHTVAVAARILCERLKRDLRFVEQRVDRVECFAVREAQFADATVRAAHREIEPAMQRKPEELERERETHHERAEDAIRHIPERNARRELKRERDPRAAEKRDRNRHTSTSS